MIWQLKDLKETTNFEIDIDYKSEISSIADIIDISLTNIVGVIRVISKNQVLFNVKITAKLILACARTLKPVDYNLDFDSEFVLGNTSDSDFPLLEVIDIKPIVFGLIISEKPYSVFHESAKSDMYDRKEEPNKAFAELADVLKK